MRKIAWWLSLVVVVALFSSVPVVRAQEPERRLAERLERLELHVQRLTAMQERNMERMGRPMEPSRDMPMVPPTVCPMPSQGAARCMRCVGHALLVGLAILHVLLAVWVYGDAQKRGVPGRGIFIVLVLLAGIPMSILYALVRIGDKVGEKSS